MQVLIILGRASIPHFHHQCTSKLIFYCSFKWLIMKNKNINKQKQRNPELFWEGGLKKTQVCLSCQLTCRLYTTWGKQTNQTGVYKVLDFLCLSSLTLSVWFCVWMFLWRMVSQSFQSQSGLESPNSCGPLFWRVWLAHSLTLTHTHSHPLTHTHTHSRSLCSDSAATNPCPSLKVW